MSGQIIKASEVRAGDTLRVTFEGVITPGMNLAIGEGRNRLEYVGACREDFLSRASSIERLPVPLKVGDRVRHVCGITFPVVEVVAIVEDSAVVRSVNGLYLARLIDLMLVHPVPETPQ